eukprot:6804703-Prymnesium_polylepis.1
MAYSTDVPFVPTGQICGHVAAVLSSADNCLSLSRARCGNGQLEEGEECDDGGTISRDGCSADCVVECGWSCEQPSQLATQPTVCSHHCGDGVVQRELGE